jgi:hypothetical protein
VAGLHARAPVGRAVDVLTAHQRPLTLLCRTVDETRGTARDDCAVVDARQKRVGRLTCCTPDDTAPHNNSEGCCCPRARPSSRRRRHRNCRAHDVTVREILLWTPQEVEDVVATVDHQCGLANWRSAAVGSERFYVHVHKRGMQCMAPEAQLAMCQVVWSERVCAKWSGVSVYVPSGLE